MTPEQKWTAEQNHANFLHEKALVEIKESQHKRFVEKERLKQEKFIEEKSKMEKEANVQATTLEISDYQINEPTSPKEQLVQRKTKPNNFKKETKPLYDPLPDKNHASYTKIISTQKKATNLHQ